MHIYLKIKAKEIAQEARYNRQEQLKCVRKAKKADAKGRTRQADYFLKQMYGMHEHLVHVVRPEARLTNIARGFLAGHEYCDIERWTYTEPDWERVFAMVGYFHEPNPKHNQTVGQRWDEWLANAKEWVKSFQNASEEERKLIIRKACPLPPKRKQVRYSIISRALIYEPD